MPVIPYVAAHTLAQIAISGKFKFIIVNPVIAFGGSTSTGSVNLVNPLMNLVKCDAVPQICWFECMF